MSAKVRITYYGMYGEGATMKEAKLDAGRKIEQAMEGSYDPFAVTWRGIVAVLARSPKSGYGYRFIYLKASDKPEVSNSWNVLATDDFEDARFQMLRHLADITRKPGETDSPLFEYLRTRTAVEYRREFEQMAKRDDFTRARFLIAQKVMKLPNGDAHDWALMNPARRELWQGTVHECMVTGYIPCDACWHASVQVIEQLSAVEEPSCA